MCLFSIKEQQKKNYNEIVDDDDDDDIIIIMVGSTKCRSRFCRKFFPTLRFFIQILFFHEFGTGPPGKNCLATIYV